MIFTYWLRMVSKASSLCTMAPNTSGCRGGTLSPSRGDEAAGPGGATCGLRTPGRAPSRPDAGLRRQGTGHRGRPLSPSPLGAEASRTQTRCGRRFLGHSGGAGGLGGGSEAALGPRRPEPSAPEALSSPRGHCGPHAQGRPTARHLLSGSMALTRRSPCPSPAARKGPCTGRREHTVTAACGQGAAARLHPGPPAPPSPRATRPAGPRPPSRREEPRRAQRRGRRGRRPGRAHTRRNAAPALRRGASRTRGRQCCGQNGLGRRPTGRWGARPEAQGR